MVIIITILPPSFDVKNIKCNFKIRKLSCPSYTDYYVATVFHAGHYPNIFCTA